MNMGSAVPDWLTPVAWTFLALSLVSAALIAADIYLGRRRHTSVATELVWIASGLYLGPFAIAFYGSRGRTSPGSLAADGTPRNHADTAVALLPGGGASAVAHLIAVPFVVAVGWTIAGLAMWPMIIIIAALVVVMVAVYERVASTGHDRRMSVGAAIVAAVITVVAFDVGMVGWMLFLFFNDAMPAVTDSTFWFLMQVGVLIGLLTGYPAVRWLLSRNRSVVPA